MPILTTLRRPVGPVATTALAVLGACLPGCGDDQQGDPPAVPERVASPSGASDPDDVVTRSPAVAPECEVRGFPCTWGEVPNDIYSATHRIARGAAYLVGVRGLSPDSVAELLGTRADVVDVAADPTALRFRLEGGRGLWVTVEGEGEGRTKGGGISHSHSHAARSPVIPATTFTETGVGMGRSDASHPIATLQTPSDRGMSVGEEGKAKHALVLTPYSWHFDEETFATDLVGRLQLSKGESRGYSTVMGGTVLYLSNDSEDDAYGTAGPSSPNTDLDPQGTVSLSAFEGWADKDFIYLSTHGRGVCQGDGSATVGSCWTYLSVGKFYDPSRALLVSFGEVPGVTVSYRSSISAENPQCEAVTDSGILFPDLDAEDVCEAGYEDTGHAHIGVTTEFFAARYGTGLPNSIVFLDACQSLAVGDIADILVGPSGKTFVFGFNRTVTDDFTKPIARKVLDFILDGTPTDKWREELKGELATGLILVGTTKAEGPGGATGAEAGGSAAAQRGARLRGRDIVELHDPGMGGELEDGGSLRVIGTPADGVPDSVHISVRGVGLPDADEARGLEITIALDQSRVLPETLHLDENPEEDVWQVDAVVPLGFDAQEDEVVDILVRGETPVGEFTEWPYKNIRLETFTWMASVDPGPYAGAYRGSDGRAQLRPDGALQSLVLRTDASDSPYVHIMVQRFSGATPSQGGTYPLPQFDDAAVAFGRTPALHDPQAQKYALASAGPEDGTVVLVIEEWSDERMRGRLEGVFVHNAYPASPGYDHPARAEDAKGTVTVSFDIPTCVISSGHPRSCRGM